MGLLMFKEPDEIVAEETVAKLDRAAAARRSAIRREASLRPHRTSDRSRDLHRERTLREVSSRNNDVVHDHDYHDLQLEAAMERLRSTRFRMRAARLDGELNRSISDLRSGLQSGTGSHNSTNSSYTLPSTTINNNLPTDLDIETSRPFRTSRESNLRYELAASHSGLSSPSDPERYVIADPVSPHFVADDDLRTLAAAAADFEPSLTPNFAPANGPYHHSTSAGARQRPIRIDDDLPDLETPPPESWENLYPPLRRVNHSSPRPDSAGTRVLDGLGDRRRSPSPISESREEETWANLLTTMESPRHSSSTTSFSSTLQSSIGSNRSSQNTATSFGEIGQGDDSCDLDLPSGITEDDVREIRARHRQNAIPDGPVMTGEMGLRMHRERTARRIELTMFQNILERMQRREEVPDEWWAAVGLSPDVVRGNA